MRKLDPSIGLSAKEIGTIKYNIKKEISRVLPELPDIVETQLFLQGRDAWVYSWSLLNIDLPIEINDIIVIEVTAKLKRDFHRYGTITRHTFSCTVKINEDVYHPKVSTTKIA